MTVNKKKIARPSVNQKIAKELASLEKGGRLLPADVVAAARSTKSAMHRWFEWDDGVAAERYRLEQARELIRAVPLVIVINHKNVATPRYVHDPEAGRTQGYATVLRLQREPENARIALRSEIDRIEACLARASAIACALGLEGEVEAISKRVARFKGALSREES